MSEPSSLIPPPEPATAPTVALASIAAPGNQAPSLPTAGKAESIPRDADYVHAAEIDHLFGPTGALGSAVSGYRPRHEQIEMAKAIASAIVSQTTLIAEAGTGTGKTFAYLAPALLWGGKVIVSTGTKN